MQVVNQIKGTYEAKETHIRKCLTQTQAWVTMFKTFEITQVPRPQNKQADALSKLAPVAFSHLLKAVLVEVLPRGSIDKPHNETMALEEEVSWMKPYILFLKKGILPEDAKEARKMRINALNYTMYGGRLYWKGHSTSWLKCVTNREAEAVIKEINFGVCGVHGGPQVTAQRIL